MGSLLVFLALTYAASWTLWIAAAALSRAAGPAFAQPGLYEQLFLPGIFAPAVVALALTARREGRAAMTALLGRMLQWKVPGRWYLFAVSYMAAIKLAVALAHRVATGAWPRFGQEAWYLIVLAIPISTLFQAGEEIGWRGYALPRLARRWGLGGASLILGVIWASWHLPLFFIPGTDKTGQSFPVYLLQVTALSVAAAWLWGHTRGSLLLVMLMHSAINQTIGIVPSAVAGGTNAFALSRSLVAWLTLAFLWIGAGAFLATMPALEASRRDVAR